MTPAWHKLIGKIIEECALNKIQFIFSGEEKVRLPNETEEAGTSGFFDGTERTLAIGNHDGWKRTLIHEYCHMKQWIDETSWFSNEAEKDNARFWDYLENKEELNKEELLKIITTMVSCERDCETRVLEFAKLYPELKINKRFYTKSANAYLMFYGFLLKYNKWYTDISPSSCPELLIMMPSKRLISIEEALNPPDKYIKRCLKYCFASIRIKTDND